MDVDRSESNDLAKENPEKLHALIRLFDEKARKNFVYPIDDRTAVEQHGIERPSTTPAK